MFGKKGRRKSKKREKRERERKKNSLSLVLRLFSQTNKKKKKTKKLLSLSLTCRRVVPRVDHHRRRPPRREARQHRVPRQEQGRRGPPFEHALDRLLARRVGLRRRLREHHRVLGRVEAEAVPERVVPEGLDDVPVGVGALLGVEGRDDLCVWEGERVEGELRERG